MHCDLIFNGRIVPCYPDVQVNNTAPMFHKMPVQIREPTNTMSELVDAIFDRHGDHINDVDASTETDHIELHDVETQCDLESVFEAENMCVQNQILRLRCDKLSSLSSFAHEQLSSALQQLDLSSVQLQQWQLESSAKQSDTLEMHSQLAADHVSLQAQHCELKLQHAASQTELKRLQMELQRMNICMQRLVSTRTALQSTNPIDTSKTFAESVPNSDFISCDHFLSDQINSDVLSKPASNFWSSDIHASSSSQQSIFCQTPHPICPDRTLLQMSLAASPFVVAPKHRSLLLHTTFHGSINEANKVSHSPKWH